MQGAAKGVQQAQHHELGAARLGGAMACLSCTFSSGRNATGTMWTRVLLALLTHVVQVGMQHQHAWHWACGFNVRGVGALAPSTCTALVVVVAAVVSTQHAWWLVGWLQRWCLAPTRAVSPMPPAWMMLDVAGAQHHRTQFW